MLLSESKKTNSDPLLRIMVASLDKHSFISPKIGRELLFLLREKAEALNSKEKSIRQRSVEEMPYLYKPREDPWP